jgi:hypothetical protein
MVLASVGSEAVGPHRSRPLPGVFVDLAASVRYAEARPHLIDPEWLPLGDPSTLLKFLALSERLKCEPRHSWLSNGQQESIAEHCWQMALMALVVHRELREPVDIEKTLR